MYLITRPDYPYYNSIHNDSRFYKLVNCSPFLLNLIDLTANDCLSKHKHSVQATEIFDALKLITNCFCINVSEQIFNVDADMCSIMLHCV